MPETQRDLLPCPFCGGAVQFRKALWVSDGCTDAVIHAYEADCGLPDFSDGSTDESIIETWNTRAAQQDGARNALHEIVTNGEHTEDGVGKVSAEVYQLAYDADVFGSDEDRS